MNAETAWRKELETFRPIARDRLRAELGVEPDPRDVEQVALGVLLLTSLGPTPQRAVALSLLRSLLSVGEG